MLTYCHAYFSPIILTLTYFRFDQGLLDERKRKKRIEEFLRNVCTYLRRTKCVPYSQYPLLRVFFSRGRVGVYSPRGGEEKKSAELLLCAHTVR